MLSQGYVNRACLAVTITVAACTAAIAESPAADRCQAAKQRAAGRYAACHLRADGKFTKGRRSGKYSERLGACSERNHTSNNAAETLYGEECPTTGDASETTAFLDGCAAAVTEATSGQGQGLCRGRVAVANRGTNTVTLIEVDTEQTLQIELEVESQPMYVHNPRGSAELWIGDRDLSRVVIYDTLRQRRITEIPTARGVFHMWSHRELGQLWVVGDIDRAMTVIDLSTKQILATVPVPPDLAANYKPHDITVTADAAIVSLLDTDGSDTGWLVAYNGTTFEETGRLAVGGDPHLMYWGFEGSLMYVASQTADEVLRVNPSDLTISGRISVEGAHGIWANEAETRLFVTNIESSTGTNGLHIIDIADGAFQSVVGSPVDTLFSRPHNVTTSAEGDRLFITHGSGDFEFTSAYDLDLEGLPTSSSPIRTGATAFGTAFVPDPLCSTGP